MFTGKGDERQISAARSQAADAQGKIEILERRFERLKLYNAALSAILVQKLGVTEAEINDLVNSIDLMDGKIDGSLTPKAAKCLQCGKVLNIHLDRCMYCGTADTARSFLETI